jgi:hypothetical protein
MTSPVTEALGFTGLIDRLTAADAILHPAPGFR